MCSIGNYSEALQGMNQRRSHGPLADVDIHTSNEQFNAGFAVRVPTWR